MEAKEVLVWDDLDVGDRFYQMFLRDTDIDAILDDMTMTYPNGLDKVHFEKRIYDRLKEAVPIGIMIKDIIQDNKGYKIFFKELVYFLPFEDFFTRGSFYLHSEKVLAPEERNINSLGLIFVGASKDNLYFELIDNLYAEYNYTIENQYEINFDDE